MKYINEAGITIRSESIRSSMPPWPGNMLPESFTPSERLISDSTRSPHVPNTHTTAPNPSICQMVKSCFVSGKSHQANPEATRQKMNPPRKPSHDFFGEIRSKSLCFPSSDPTQYAPVSLSQISTNINIVIRLPISPYSTSSNVRRSTIYICPNMECAK